MRYLLIVLLLFSCSKKTIKPVVINVPVEKPVVEIEKDYIYWPEKKINKKDIKEMRDTFYFKFDCDEMDREEAERLLKFSNKIPEGHIVYVRGGCCPIGTQEYNLNLGWRRAKYGQYFINMIIDNEILVDNYGESNLISTIDLWRNRRIEVETRKN